MTNVVSNESKNSNHHRTKRSVRPWLVSLVLHTFGLLFLALWVAPSLRGGRVKRLKAALAEGLRAAVDAAIAVAEGDEETE